MTEKGMEPALTTEEWRTRSAHVQPWQTCYVDLTLRKEGLDISVLLSGADDSIDAHDLVSLPPEALPATIALANAALADSDPRKITREKIETLREVIDNFYAAYETAGGNNPKIAAQYGPIAEAFADALESYLPPLTDG